MVNVNDLFTLRTFTNQERKRKKKKDGERKGEIKRQRKLETNNERILSVYILTYTELSSYITYERYERKQMLDNDETN